MGVGKVYIQTVLNCSSRFVWRRRLVMSRVIPLSPVREPRGPPLALALTLEESESAARLNLWCAFAHLIP